MAIKHDEKAKAPMSPAYGLPKEHVAIEATNNATATNCMAFLATIAVPTNVTVAHTIMVDVQ